MHQLIHDECRACHVSRVFHDGYEQVQDEDVGQEDDDTAHTADDTVDNHVFQRSLGHVIADERTDLFHQPFDALHGVVTQYIGSFKDDKEQEEEEGKAPDAMSDNRVDDLCHLLFLQMVVGECLT